MNSGPIAFLDGDWLPYQEMRLPVWDAGFVWGATVTEQLRTFGGRIFRFDEHLQRLEQSLRIMDIVPGFSAADFSDVTRRLVASNYPLLDHGDLGICIFVTPGAYPAFCPHEDPGPSVGVHSYPLRISNWAKAYKSGQRTVTTAIRQVSEHCWPAALKCRSRVHYYLANRSARQTEAASVPILLSDDGMIRETPIANVIAAINQELVSPPLDKILSGISLDFVRQLAHDLGIPFHFRELTVADLATADEVLLTSTPFCLLPTTFLNGRPIAGGIPGVLFQQLIDRWSDTVGIDILDQATTSIHAEGRR